MDHWAYPGVKVLRSLGLLDGGYSNEYGLDNALSKGRLQNLMNNAMGKTGKQIAKVFDVADPVTYENMIEIVARVAGMSGDTYEERLMALQEAGIMTEVILAHFGDKMDTPTVGDAVMLVANLYTYHMEQQ